MAVTTIDGGVWSGITFGRLSGKEPLCMTFAIEGTVPSSVGHH